MSLFEDADLNTYLDYFFWGIEKSARYNTFNFPRNNKTPPAAPYKKHKMQNTVEDTDSSASIPVAFCHAGTRMPLSPKLLDLQFLAINLKYKQAKG